MSIPVVLFDGEEHVNLLPLTFTKPVCELRVGIFTIKEKWQKITGRTVFTETQDYLKQKFTSGEYSDAIFINASLLPDKELWEACESLQLNEGIGINGRSLIFRSEHLSKLNNPQIKWKKYPQNVLKINHYWDLFKLNESALLQDINHFFANRSDTLPAGIRHFGKHKVIIEDGAKVRGLSVNTEDGPVYIGKNSEIMEGAVIRGPIALLENAVIKMGAKIYGATTIGPHSKVGGELNNVVIQGFSNKAHDGFLGNSVIGEWCNLGADTNNSNLKNNYGNVKSWSYKDEQDIDTGLQFCGLIMGDHSKCGINTMFNTGTVVGVCANIFGGGFPPKFIPSFSWGGADGLVTYQLEKAFETIERVFERRNLKIEAVDREILTSIFNQTTKYRNFNQ